MLVQVTWLPTEICAELGENWKSKTEIEAVVGPEGGDGGHDA